MFPQFPTPPNAPFSPIPMPIPVFWEITPYNKTREQKYYIY